METRIISLKLNLEVQYYASPQTSAADGTLSMFGNIVAEAKSSSGT